MAQHVLRSHHTMRRAVVSLSLPTLLLHVLLCCGCFVMPAECAHPQLLVLALHAQTP